MYKIYQVEYGDTIDIIASKTGSTPNTIKNINGFNSDGDLVVGSLIIVPRGETQLFQTYMIKQGDSIYSISRKYNVDPETLLLLNGLKKLEYRGYDSAGIAIVDENKTKIFKSVFKSPVDEYCTQLNFKMESESIAFV